MGSFSFWHWLIVLAIVVLVFGTKKLRNLSGDLGSAIKKFKGAVKDGETEVAKDPTPLASAEKAAKETAHDSHKL